MSFVSGFALLQFVLSDWDWLEKAAHFLNHSEVNSKTIHDLLAHVAFSRLGAIHVHLFRVLIGPLCYLHLSCD